MGRRQQLVCQQLENASSDVLEKYPDVISHYMRRRNGVYALYRRERLYYVGLATNLRSRLKQHLRDRHRGLWDRFSVYLTIGSHHIREMESLLLRILRPVGNKQNGRFVRCEDLAKRLSREIEAIEREERINMLGQRRRAEAKRARDSASGTPVLAAYVTSIRRNRLRGQHKGMVVRARVRNDGAIIVRGFKGRRFKSPSLAARHVVKHPKNGWQFWHYERSPGEWVQLKHLRD